MKIFFLLLYFISSFAWAKPDRFEVWFLSTQQKKKISLHMDKIVWSKFISLNTNDASCDPVGDYCFDPQIGLYKKNKGEIELANPAELPSDDGEARALLKGTDTDLINCDRQLFFDVFCGKAKKEEKENASFEVWVDVSSSLREYDGQDKDGGCYRKSFGTRLKERCGNKPPKIQVFNNSIKSMSTLDTLCDSVGLNDQKRLMKWIENSDAKNLIIITDINEFTKELADFIDMHGGSSRGDNPSKPLVPSDLLEQIDSAANYCK